MIEMMFIDSHCHIDDDETVMRAFQAGVGGILNAGKDVDESEEQLLMCRSFMGRRKKGEKVPQVWTSAGVHPDSASRKLSSVDIDTLIQAAANPYVIAIGECGLDYHYGAESKEEQKEMFARHIEAAGRTGLPLMIHQREAEDDMTALLKKGVMRFGKLAGVIHCFSSTSEFAAEMLKLGFYLSASGIVTFKSASDVASVFADCPAEQILIETDSPYLTPVPYRGKTNEPAFVCKTAEKIAAIRGLTIEETARITTDNFFRLYQKAQR